MRHRNRPRRCEAPDRHGATPFPTFRPKYPRLDFVRLRANPRASISAAKLLGFPGAPRWIARILSSRRVARTRVKMIGRAVTPSIHPLPKSVLLIEIALRRFQHPLRSRKSLSLPFETTVDRPLQNACRLFAEKVRQRLVDFMLRDRDVERDQMQASPNRIVHAAKARLMVPNDQELELRNELKEIHLHESRTDLVAAS